MARYRNIATNVDMRQAMTAHPGRRDLEEFAEYIAMDNPTAAPRNVRGVFSAVELLNRYSQSGRRPEELPAISRPILHRTEIAALSFGVPASSLSTDPYVCHRTA
jgi:plasmid stabilization system protein ParE